MAAGEPKQQPDQQQGTMSEDELDKVAGGLLDVSGRSSTTTTSTTTTTTSTSTGTPKPSGWDLGDAKSA